MFQLGPLSVDDCHNDDDDGRKVCSMLRYSERGTAEEGHSEQYWQDLGRFACRRQRPNYGVVYEFR